MSGATAETTAPKQRGVPFAPGKSGNPAGRPKGARHILAGDFLKALQEDFQKNGAEVIAAVREEKPDQYLKVIASVIPKEIEAPELTDALAALLAEIDGRSKGLPNG